MHLDVGELYRVGAVGPADGVEQCGQFGALGAGAPGGGTLGYQGADAAADLEDLAHPSGVVPDQHRQQIRPTEPGVVPHPGPDAVSGLQQSGLDEPAEGVLERGARDAVPVGEPSLRGR